MEFRVLQSGIFPLASWSWANAFVSPVIEFPKQTVVMGFRGYTAEFAPIQIPIEFIFVERLDGLNWFFLIVASLQLAKTLAANLWLRPRFPTSLTVILLLYILAKSDCQTSTRLLQSIAVLL